MPVVFAEHSLAISLDHSSCVEAKRLLDVLANTRFSALGCCLSKAHFCCLSKAHVCCLNKAHPRCIKTCGGVRVQRAAGFARARRPAAETRNMWVWAWPVIVVTLWVCARAGSNWPGISTCRRLSQAHASCLRRALVGNFIRSLVVCGSQAASRCFS